MSISISFLRFACLSVAIHLSLITSSAVPRVLPQSQASHFCQLFVNEQEGKTYPLHLYARHLTTMLYGEPSYGNFTAEQVFTGLIFFYDDWIQEPFILGADYDRLLLIKELHGGTTLRVFPHLSGKNITWYAPTDQIPESIDIEHRRYMKDVFSRLNGEVQAGNWQTVDAYIDRMIKYQCQYGSNNKNRQGNHSFQLLFTFFWLFVLFFVTLHPKWNNQ